MNTDWNMRKTQFVGKAISWGEKDDIQRLLTILQNDVVDTLNSVLEYRFVLDFTTEHLPFVNKSPQFWGEVVKSLRFTMIMNTARLFDESKDAIGIKKAFDKLEQSSYRSIVINELSADREQYVLYHKYIEEIRTIRDKTYAHNDKKEYQFWKYPVDKDLEFEGEFWGKIEEILIWARDSLLSLRTLTGDSYPVNREITNDLIYLLSN